MGCRTVKTIKGRRYLYYSYYLDGKKMQEYCGIDGTREADGKAMRCALRELKGKRKEVDERIADINEEIGNL